MTRVLCIGGLEPTGRAGLLADAWAVREAGAEPWCVATALTAQGKRRFSLNPVRPAVLAAQLDAALSVGPVHAVKLGMIASSAQLAVVFGACRRARCPVVVDPVIFTSRGERLSRLSPREVRSWGRLGAVLTPNADELKWLNASPEGLLDEGFEAVLLKGGDTALDVLTTRAGRRVFRSRPVRRNPAQHRGTGCRLASALAARVAEGDDLVAAVRKARGVVFQFLNRPIIAGSFY